MLAETRALLALDFEIISCVRDGHALLKAVMDGGPDCVVADIEMPHQDGIAAATEIIHRNLCRAVVVLSVYDDPQLIRRALRIGIGAYVLKDDAGEELIAAVRAALAGQRYLSRGAAAAAAAD